MPAMTMHKGEGVAQDLADKGYIRIHLGDDAPPIRVGYLDHGMQSGKPSLAFVFELPGAQAYVLAETSAALFLQLAGVVRIWAEQGGWAWGPNGFEQQPPSVPN